MREYAPAAEKYFDYEQMAWADALDLAQQIDTVWPNEPSIKAKLERAITRSAEVFSGYLNSDHFQPEAVQHLAYASHAVREYLQHCLDENAPEAAQFLFPPDFDLKHIAMKMLNGEETGTALEAFAQIHRVRNTDILAKIKNEIDIAENGGKIISLTGPMYASKSGLAKQLHHALSQEGDVELHTLIFSGMGESELHARAVQGEDIKADKVDLAELKSFAENLLAQPKTHRRSVIFIEEITFFTSKQQEARALMGILTQLANNGFHVITVGLRENYRAEELLIEQYLTGLEDERPELIKRYKLKSIQAYQNGTQSVQLLKRQRAARNAASGNLKPTDLCAANSTVRYDMATGMYDWFLPIFFPRDEAGALLEYRPMQRRFHPMLVLKKRDPELYARMIALQQGGMKEFYKDNRTMLTASI